MWIMWQNHVTWFIIYCCTEDHGKWSLSMDLGWRDLTLGLKFWFQILCWANINAALTNWPHFSKQKIPFCTPCFTIGFSSLDLKWFSSKENFFLHALLSCWIFYELNFFFNYCEKITILPASAFLGPHQAQDCPELQPRTDLAGSKRCQTRTTE